MTTLAAVGVLDAMADGAFEQVVHCHDGPSGLRAIIAIHSTRLGPALGGVRYYPYPDEAAALADVLRLARGMTYKAAAAGLDLGGGKAVIIGDPATKTEALIRAYGRFVDSLGGRYLTAEDVGTTQTDMDLIRRETVHVTGTTAGSGDPSQATAIGVRAAIRAVAGDLRGLRVVIAGVGKVGGALARLLTGDGAAVTVADVDPARTASLPGVTVVGPGEAHRQPCDVFSPCALGGILSAATIAELECRAVVGAANNQLAHPSDAKLLADRGITYAPDFVVNAGGIINIAEELSPSGYDPERARVRVEEVGATVRAVLDESAARGVTPLEAAEQRAEARMAAIAAVHLLRRGRQ